MPTILTNTQQAGRPGQPQNAIGLPDGRILEAGASLQYDAWEDIKDRPNIKHYVDNKLIEVSKGKLKADETDADETDQAKAAREAEEIAAHAAEANKHAEQATNTARNTGGRNNR